MYQRLLYGVMGALMVGCVCAWGPHDGCAHTMSPNMPSSEEGAAELTPHTGQMPCMPSVLTPDSPKATLHMTRGGWLLRKKTWKDAGWRFKTNAEARAKLWTSPKARRNERKKEQEVEQKVEQWKKERQAKREAFLKAHAHQH